MSMLDFFEPLSRQTGSISVQAVRDGMVEELEITPEDEAIQEMDEILEQDPHAAFASYHELYDLLMRHNYEGIPEITPSATIKPDLQVEADTPSPSRATPKTSKSSASAPHPAEEARDNPGKAESRDRSGSPGPVANHEDPSAKGMTPDQVAKGAKAYQPARSVIMKQGFLSSAGDLIRNANPFSKTREEWMAKAPPDHFENLGMETPQLAELQVAGLNSTSEQIRAGLQALENTDSDEVRGNLHMALLEQGDQLARRVQDMQEDVQNGRFEESSRDEIANSLNKAKNVAQDMVESEAVDEALREKIKKQMDDIMELVTRLLNSVFGREPDAPAPA